MYVKPKAVPPVYDNSLDRQLQRFGDWQSVQANRLSTAVIDALLLDDFLFRTYGKNGQEVTLYIGYYYTGGKIGAAHAPQVCYPGQGWILSDSKTQKLVLQDGTVVNHASIKAELEDRAERIFFWYQVNDRTTADTFNQKLQLLRSKVLGGSEVNAFVRLSTSLENIAPSEADEVLNDFVKDFYPVFKAYVTK